MIREATPADVEVVLALIGELAEYEHLADEMVCTPEDLRRELSVLHPVLKASLVEEDGGAVAGMALWCHNFSTFDGRRGIWLEDLFVREPFRGRGHGRALLDHLRSMTGGRVQWAVLDWNVPAVAFYEGLGARPLNGWTTYRWPPKSQPNPPLGR